MNGLALILVGIFLLNLFVAVWLVILALIDRYQHREATREVEALERSLALPSPRPDVLAARRIGASGTLAVRDRTRRAIVGRGSPGLPRLVGRAGISLALAATALWVAVALPDLDRRPTITSAQDGTRNPFPPAWERLLGREASPGFDSVTPRVGSPSAASLAPDVSTDPSSATPKTTDTDFEGRTVPGRVAAKSRSSTAISLAWAMVPEAIGYRVERSETQDLGWQGIARVEEDMTTYTDYGLEADTTYYYRVAAVTEDGLAPPSDVVSATTSIGPPAATSLIATETATTIDLVWVDVADETGYRIERSLDGTGEWISIGTTGQDVTVYSDEALSSGVKYQYRVVATNAGGDSAPSNVVSAKINTPKDTSPVGESPPATDETVVIEESDQGAVTEEAPEGPGTEESQ